MFILLRKLLAGSVLLLVGIFANLAYAQSFTHEADVTITKGESVKISNVDDWLIGVFTSLDTINTSQYLWDQQCVYSSTGAYSIQVSSANGGGALHLESSSGDEMNYRIYSFYRRNTGGYTLRAFNTSNFTITGLRGSSVLDCSDQPVNGVNLWFAPLVTPADFNPAPPGIYQDLISLTVTPE